MDLSNRSVALTYKDLLLLDNANNGLDSLLRHVSDGKGALLPIKISEDSLLVLCLISIENNVSIKGAFYLDGDMTSTGNVSISKNLLVQKGLSILGNSEVIGSQNIGNSLEVGDLLTVLGDIKIKGKSTFQSDSYIGGSVEVSGSLGVDKSVTVKEYTTLMKDVSVGGILNMNLKRIYHLADPSNDYDAINRRYLESQLDTLLQDVINRDIEVNRYSDDKNSELQVYVDQQDTINRIYTDTSSSNVLEVMSDRLREVDNLISYIANEVAPSGDFPVWPPPTYSGDGVITVVEVLPSDNDPKPDSYTAQPGVSPLYSRYDHVHPISELYAESDHSHEDYENTISGIQDNIAFISGLVSGNIDNIALLSGFIDATASGLYVYASGVADNMYTYTANTVSGLYVYVSGVSEDLLEDVQSSTSGIVESYEALVSGYQEENLLAISSISGYVSVVESGINNYIANSVSGIEESIGDVYEEISIVSGVLLTYIDEEVLSAKEEASSLVSGLSAEVSGYIVSNDAAVSGLESYITASISGLEDTIETTASGFEAELASSVVLFKEYVDDLEEYVDITVSGLYVYIDGENDAQDVITSGILDDIVYINEDIAELNSGLLERVTVSGEQVIYEQKTFFDGLYTGNNVHEEQDIFTFDTELDVNTVIKYDIDYFGEPNTEFFRVVAGQWTGAQESVCWEVETQDGRKAVILARNTGLSDGVAEVGAMLNPNSGNYTLSRYIALNTQANEWKLYQRVGDTEREIVTGTYTDNKLKITSITSTNVLLKIDEDGNVAEAVPGVDYVPVNMLATHETAGLMTAEDKRKLDLIDWVP